MIRRLWLAPTLAALVFGSSAAEAASATRIWVSGHGVDEAGYGAVTITKPVSIVNDGVGAAGVQASSGAAITVNAGADALSPGTIFTTLDNLIEGNPADVADSPLAREALKWRARSQPRAMR